MKVPSADFHPERYVPYRLLWAKVIIRAAYDWALWKDSKDVRLKNFAKDAYRWLFSESDLMNSFNRVCEVLNVDRAKIRNYALNLTKDQVKKLEFMEREGRDPMRSIIDEVMGRRSLPEGDQDDDGDGR